MYLSSGSKNGVAWPLRVDLVDAAVRRGADVEAAVRRRRERVDFHLGAVEEHRAVAVAIDAHDLAVVAGAEEHRLVRPGEHRPDKRHAGVVHAPHLGPEHQAAVFVDRQVLDVAAEEIGLRRGLPEAGRRAGERSDSRASRGETVARRGRRPLCS